MTRIAATGTALALLATTAAAQAQEAEIEEALSAAPPQLRDEVTVRDLDGTLLRDGNGDFVRMPAPDGFAGPMCVDGPWMNWFAAYQAQEDFDPTRIGISYMLAGDTTAGGASNIDPYARTPGADNDWVVEGPHVMIIVPDDAILEGLPETPTTDGPYVMWPDTPYAHIMLPVAARPEQRAID